MSPRTDTQCCENDELRQETRFLQLSTPSHLSVCQASRATTNCEKLKVLFAVKRDKSTYFIKNIYNRVHFVKRHHWHKRRYPKCPLSGIIPSVYKCVSDDKSKRNREKERNLDSIVASTHQTKAKNRILPAFIVCIVAGDES